MPTALIVEDDPDQAEMAARLLRYRNFESEIAGTGGVGLEKARSLKPDVVLLDLMLPDTTGFDVCRELRLDRQTMLTPVVMLTALGDECLHPIATVAGQQRGRAGECPCDARIDETSHQREQLRVLLTALGELPDRQREALVMREFEGRSYVHIGARLGLGEGAVAQLLNRARRTLRRKLSALNGVAPVLRWTSSGGGGAIATPAGGAAGCVATAKVCAAVLLPALTTSLAAVAVGTRAAATLRVSCTCRRFAPC